jgi:hypothetical protein
MITITTTIMLKRILGPWKVELMGEWRTLYNVEIHN